MVRYTPSSSTRSTMYQKIQFSYYIHNSGLNKPQKIIRNLMGYGAPPRPINVSSTKTSKDTSIPYFRTQSPTSDAYDLFQVPTHITFLCNKLNRTQTVNTRNMCALTPHYFRKMKTMAMKNHRVTVTYRKIKGYIHPQSGTESHI